MPAYRRYDIEAVRSVRSFRGHMDRVTDLRMSADARWLLSSSLDGTLRVWDVPSARCLQVSPSAKAILSNSAESPSIGPDVQDWTAFVANIDPQAQPKWMPLA